MLPVALAAVAVLLAAATAYLTYRTSLQVRPWRACRACRGSGKTRGRIWKTAGGTCPKCRGGRVPRLGVRLLQRERARQMRPAPGAHKKADRRDS